MLQRISTIHKIINLKWIKDLKIRKESINDVEENIGRTFQGIKGFALMTQEAK